MSVLDKIPFKRFLGIGKKISSEGNDAVSEVRNWYSDRYQSAIVQRNILLLIVFLSIIAVAVASFSVYEISTSKSIEPFVIEIEEESGLTIPVKPENVLTYSMDEILRNYFIAKYLRARETYHIASYNYDYFTTVRLLSNSDVYSSFRIFILRDEKSPINRYQNHTSTSIKIHSIQPLPPSANVPFKSQVRFSIIEQGNIAKSQKKVAIIDFGFYPQFFKSEELFVNPLGFLVVGYRVDDEL